MGREEAIKNKKVAVKDGGNGERPAGPVAHSGHGGCGMHGGGIMKWLWVGLLIYAIASYIR
jgi:hypothetical protein